MDNFHVDITCKGMEALRAALVVAFSGRSSGATHWCVIRANEPDAKHHRNAPRLLLFWHEDPSKNTLPLPYALNASNAFDFVWQWLQSVAPAHSEPDLDGSVGKGWRLWNEDWGHVEGSFYGICAIAPEWAWFGK